MKGGIKVILICMGIGLAGILFISQRSEAVAYTVKSEADGVQGEDPYRPAVRLKEKADTARVFCEKRGFNMDYCFLVDFSIHSGKKRFFVWDFKGDSIRYSSLCAHGYGQNSTARQPVFSNVEGSYCSSLGRYKVGIRSYSQWGIHVHYKLHGLDKTNDNAYKRIVVIHSFDPVPEKEIYPAHLPLGMSQGCPVISNETMSQIDALQKKAQKPTLLWIYN